MSETQTKPDGAASITMASLAVDSSLTSASKMATSMENLTTSAALSSHDPTSLLADVSVPLVTPFDVSGDQACPVITMRRSSSVDDIWLKYSSRLHGDFDVDFDDTASLMSVDSTYAASEGEFSGVPKATGWKTSCRSLREIVEEGGDDDGGSRSDVVRPDTKPAARYKKRQHPSVEPERCQQGLIWRWLASTAVTPDGKVKGIPKTAEEKICKDFAYTFKSRELNVVAPSNF